MTASSPRQRPEIRVVLVEPEHAGNVGAVARVIANMGLAGLDVVGDGDLGDLDARRLAWRSHDVLDAARRFETIREAVAGATLVAGWTGRSQMRVEPITPAAFAREVESLPPPASVALVFGPESRGLSESELCACQRRVRIETDPGHPSLNLAQAVVVAAYELTARGEAPGEPTGGVQRAPAELVDAALAQLADAMLAIDYLPAENPEARFVEWRELFGRAGLSEREVRLMRALARRMAGAARASSDD